MSLYYDDILLWGEQQADLLREGRFSELDLDNVIEVVGDAGTDQLYTLEKHLTQGLWCYLKILSWPQASKVKKWRSKTFRHFLNVRTFVTPTIRQRLDLNETYRFARQRLPLVWSGIPAQPVPYTCPVGWDALLKNAEYLLDDGKGDLFRNEL